MCNFSHLYSFPFFLSFLQFFYTCISNLPFNTLYIYFSFIFAKSCSIIPLFHSSIVNQLSLNPSNSIGYTFPTRSISQSFPIVLIRILIKAYRSTIIDCCFRMTLWVVLLRYWWWFSYKWKVGRMSWTCFKVGRMSWTSFKVGIMPWTYFSSRSIVVMVAAVVAVFIIIIKIDFMIVIVIIITTIVSVVVIVAKIKVAVK